MKNIDWEDVRYYILMGICVLGIVASLLWWSKMKVDRENERDRELIRSIRIEIYRNQIKEHERKQESLQKLPG